MNAVDIAVIVVLLASGVFALMRGFIYEVLAVAGWVAAALAAVWGLPWVRPLVKPYISNQTFADVAGGAAIFLVVLILCSIITHAVARRVQRSAIGSVDRSLGFAFGLARGAALASLCFILATSLTSKKPEEMPDMLRNAKSRPLMEIGARVIGSLVPSQLSAVENSAKGASDMMDDARQAKEMYDRLQAPKPRGGDQPQNGAKTPAYDSHGLERLIETNQSNPKAAR